MRKNNSKVLKLNKTLVIILAIIIIAVVIFSYFYTDKFTKFPDWFPYQPQSSSFSSASNSVSSSNCGSSGNLYEQYSNDFTYLDKFSLEKQSYNRITRR